MKVAKHPTLNILVREDGAVLLPPCSLHKKQDWTFGRVNKQGYMEIKFMYKNYRVHRLLAETFIENPNGYKEVDHINRNRTDNRLQNLRWANRKMQADNKKSVDDSIKKYGVRCCDDVKGYDKARYKILKQDKNWVIEKRKKANDYAAKNRDKINERQRNRRTRLHEETNAYERNRYKKNIEFERKRQRMYRERMKNEGKVRVLINGHRKWIDKNIAEKFKDKEV